MDGKRSRIILDTLPRKFRLQGIPVVDLAFVVLTNKKVVSDTICFYDVCVYKGFGIRAVKVGALRVVLSEVGTSTRYDSLPGKGITGVQSGTLEELRELVVDKIWWLLR